MMEEAIVIQINVARNRAMLKFTWTTNSDWNSNIAIAGR
jgi:hypothetical protein